MYTREDLEWIESEYIFYTHGRVAVLSFDDFQTLVDYEKQNLAPAKIVESIAGEIRKE